MPRVRGVGGVLGNRGMEYRRMNHLIAAIILLLATTIPAMSIGVKVSPIESGNCTSGDFVTGYAPSTGARACGTPTAGAPAGSNGDIQLKSGSVFSALTPGSGIATFL